MTNTTYYNLNIVEGTDIVNPLTVDNPNYEKIDEVMHDNAVSGVTLATEIANATVHAITRENSECAVIRFIATSRWKAGDTITVDGVPVTALLPSGETLPDGAYVINANVLCILTGTNLTVYADRKKIDNASEIKYNDTNVADAITEINNNLGEFPAGFDSGGLNTNQLVADLTTRFAKGESLSSTRNADLYTYNGIYSSARWESTAPSTYGILFVFGDNQSYIAQIFINVVQGEILYRYTNNGHSNWAQWVKLH